jgi:hypothetical protein
LKRLAMSNNEKTIAITICVFGVILLVLFMNSIYSKLEDVKEEVANLRKEWEPDPEPGPVTIDVTPEYVKDSDSNAQSAQADISTEKALATVPDSTRKSDLAPDFRYSDDFRTVTHNGREYHLTTSQSRVVEKLWEAYKNKTPEVHQATLLEKLEIYSKRIRDVFKNSPALNCLIVRGETKGTFRLNLF